MARRRFTENMRRCPDCKRDISRSATNCPLCGCDIISRDQQNRERNRRDTEFYLRRRGIDTTGMTENEMGKKWRKEIIKELKEQEEAEKREEEKAKKEKIRKKEEERKKFERKWRAEAKAQGLTYEEYMNKEGNKALIIFAIIFVIIMMLSYC
tara:strand:+ start:217 stop:675 length:459 start_codon:yes stop_codon:yes gene_type:complete